MDFEEMMNDFIEKVESISTNMSIEDRIRINYAGALVGKKALKEYIKKQHYRERETGKDPHLSDSIQIKKTNINGIPDGSVIIGFDKKVAYIARFINDGTKIPQFTKVAHRQYKHPGQTALEADHFMDKVFNDPAVVEAIHEAMVLEYNKIAEIRMNGGTPDEPEEDDSSVSVESSSSKSYNGVRKSTAKSDKRLSDAHKVVQVHKLDEESEPNTVIANLDKKGNLKEKKYYGPDGKVTKEIHYTDHGNAKKHPIVPHAHDRIGGVRSEARLLRKDEI